MQLEPTLIQKNYSLARTDSLSGSYTKFTNSYVQVPLIIQSSFGKRLKFILNGGGYLGYWILGRISGKTPNIFSATTNGASLQNESFQLSSFDQNYAFNPQRDNRIEVGWVVGTGLQYKIIRKYYGFAKLSYYNSLTDQQKKYTINHSKLLKSKFL